jgi:hypothetical protein
VEESDIGEFQIIDYVQNDKLIPEFLFEAAFFSQVRAYLYAGASFQRK